MGWVNFPSHTATLVVKAGFRIVPGGVCEPLDEQSLEGDVMSKAQEPECLYDADMAQFKPKADLLLTGTCHTPGGKALTATTATFRVGDWSKSVACIGNRSWEKGLIRSSMSEPESFTKVPITWKNAFGGPKYKLNPAGKGHKDVILPNIEDPDDLIGGAGDKPKPAGFGPIYRTWKSRAGKLGTYDKKWLKERFPAWPKDFDWTYFNAAPQDEQGPIGAWANCDQCGVCHLACASFLGPAAMQMAAPYNDHIQHASSPHAVTYPYLARFERPPSFAA